MWQRTIDCLGISVRVTSPFPELAAQLTAVLGTYADSSRPADLEYELAIDEYPLVLRGGRFNSAHDTTSDLVPALEIELNRQVIARVPGLPLHAGALVGATGAAIVFTGPSGAGKSTLVRAFLERGYRYLSEECVAVFARQRCLGLARALHVDDPDVVLPAGFISYDYKLRGRGGPPLRLFHPPEHVMWRGDARTAGVVVIDHGDNADGSLVRLTGGEALAAIWPTVFRHDPPALDRATAGLADVPIFQLRTSSSNQALERAIALASELGV